MSSSVKCVKCVQVCIVWCRCGSVVSVLVGSVRSSVKCVKCIHVCSVVCDEGCSV